MLVCCSSLWLSVSLTPVSIEFTYTTQHNFTTWKFRRWCLLRRCLQNPFLTINKSFLFFLGWKVFPAPSSKPPTPQWCRIRKPEVSRSRSQARSEARLWRVSGKMEEWMTDSSNKHAASLRLFSVWSGGFLAEKKNNHMWDCNKIIDVRYAVTRLRHVRVSAALTVHQLLNRLLINQWWRRGLVFQARRRGSGLVFGLLSGLCVKVFAEPKEKFLPDCLG